MNSVSRYFGLRPAIFLLILFCGLALSACGGGGGDGSADASIDGPLEGSPAALASSAIEDSYIFDPVDATEYSEDAFGRQVRRTGFKIVFTDQATVAEVNELLVEFSAEIVASLGGYPALVVRIPDPGSLQALEETIATVQSRGVVKSVLKSLQSLKLDLPPNVYSAIFDSGNEDPKTDPRWESVLQHITVRGAAAWHLASLAQKPFVVVADYFGAEDPSTFLFDIEPIPIETFQNETEFGLPNAGTLESHGYSMLSIISARHSVLQDENDFAPVWASGMVPVGTSFHAVDIQGIDYHAFNLALLLKLASIADLADSTIVVNLSIGDTCTSTVPTDACLSREELNPGVTDFINMVRHEGLEDKVLFVAAAGNIGPGRDDSAPEGGPTDAESSSLYNAAGLMDGWVDPLSQEPIDPLTNVLVVENATRTVNGPPFQPECVIASSFRGGQIAGIGDSFNIAGPGGTPMVVSDGAVTGGTSSATAQVSGVAAYLTGLRSDLTPQEIIRVLVATGEDPDQSAGFCSQIESEAVVVDAYAAMLATDPVGFIDKTSARARLELLDVASDFTPFDTANPIPPVSPDGSFDIRDLRRWISVLTGTGAGTIDHSRFDLNGDGVVGGEGVERFDLDISMDLFSDSSLPFLSVQYELLDDTISLAEDTLTDMQIVCYYAMSPLYELGGIDPFTAEGRAEELENVKDLCDPCAVAQAEPAGINSVGVLSASASAANEPICEGVVVTVEPSSATVQKGGTVQFSATITGASDTTVSWSAGGGSIDQDGLYTAGDSPGAFTVTATSAANPSASATATVTIAAGNPVKGQWLGNITVIADSGKVSTCATLIPERPDDCVEFAFRDEPWTPGFPETVRGRLLNAARTEVFFTGTFDGTTFTGDRTRSVINTGFTQVFERGCVITLTVSDSTITGSMAEGTFYGGCDGKRQSEYLLTCAEEQGCDN